MRWALGAAGLAVMGWGVWLLLDLDLDRLLSAGIWIVGGIVVHDAILAPLTIVVAALAAKVVPRGTWPVVAAGLAVWAILTVVAIPVLSGLGGKPDNDTILVHPYRTWWLGLTVALAVITAGIVVLRTRRAEGGIRR